MSNILIIYKSQYGATKSYATYISEHTGAVVKSFKEVRKKDLVDAKTIVFGGGVYISKLSVLKTLKRYLPTITDKDLYLFAVGLTDHACEAIPKIQQTNPEIATFHFKNFYYYPGTFDVSKMRFFHRTMLHMIKNMVSKKPEMTPDEKDLYEAIIHPQDKRDMQLTHPLIQDLKESERG